MGHAIRPAIGAPLRSVVGVMLRDTGLVVAAAVNVAVPAALAAGRFVASLLFGVEPSDPLTLRGRMRDDGPVNDCGNDSGDSRRPHRSDARAQMRVAGYDRPRGKKRPVLFMYTR